MCYQLARRKIIEKPSNNNLKILFKRFINVFNSFIISQHILNN